MSSLISLASRLLFLGSILLVLLAVFEKIANMNGYTLLHQVMTPSRMLEMTIVPLLVVIALQLRELKGGH
jgi:hypothetical protein